MQEALRLLVVGMGTVFSFLTLLVLVMYVSAARLLSRFEDPVVEAPGQVPGVAANDAEIALAIAVAERALRAEAE